MVNAEEIIEIEKKWLKYKIKQKSKFYALITTIVLIISITIYQLYFHQSTDSKQPINVVKIEKKPLTQEIVTNSKEYTSIKPAAIKENKIKTAQSVDKNVSKVQEIKEITKKNIDNKINTKPYYFKLEPTTQGNELFSSDGFLTFNSPLRDKDISLIQKNTIVTPIKETEKRITIPKEKEEKSSISIDMKDIDTTTYLKEKFYATSSIVFALMLAEEYYYDKKYSESLKWSLIANDIDSQNTKTWYWFAKSKVKLNQREDAIRALKAYLANNKSKRLSTLLQKIVRGDTDD